MNINDYKKVMQRMKVRPELEKEIIDMSIEKNEKKRRFSKKRIIPVCVAVALGCTALTVVYADQFVGIFKKDTNFQMSIRTVEESKSEQVNIYNAVPKVWDEEKIHSLFSDGKTIIDTTEYQSDINPDTSIKCINYKDGFTLTYENGCVRYYGNDDYDYAYIADRVFWGMDNGEVLFPESEIEGLDVQSAVEQSDKIVNELGIPVNSKEIIALDVENLKIVDDTRNENGERIYKNGKVLDEWTTEQEAYLIIYTVDVNGIPMTSNSQLNGKTLIEGTSVFAIVGRNGLELFDAYDLYDTVEEEKLVSICTVEEAAEAVAQKFDKEIASFPTDIENCKLVYVPETVEYGKSYKLCPAWEFYSSEHVHWYTPEFEKETMDHYETIFVDAEICEIIE